jgi:hypothetical protein
LHWFAKVTGYPARTLGEITAQVTHLDVGWYIAIAKNGYWIDPTRLDQSVVFFPLFPLLIRGVHELTSMDFGLSAIVVQKLSAVAMFAALVWWIRSFAPPPHFSTLCTVFLTFHPAAIFLYVPYTEALFLSMVFLPAGLLEGPPRQSTPWIAGLCALAMGLTRPGGLFLLPCAAVMMVLVRKQPAQRNVTLSLIVGALVAIVIFAATLQYFVGETSCLLCEAIRRMERSPVTNQSPPAHPTAHRRNKHGTLPGHLRSPGRVCVTLAQRAEDHRAFLLAAHLASRVPGQARRYGSLLPERVSGMDSLYPPCGEMAVRNCHGGYIQGLYAFHLLILWLQRGWVG